MENVTIRQLVNILNDSNGKERTLNLYVNRKYYGNITSAKLDGWGDGLILMLTTAHDEEE